MKSARNLYAAKESGEQQAVMEWAERCRGRWPELRLLYHIANERHCSPAQGARLKAQGVKKGVPDLCLPVARGGFHGLYVELKRPDGGRTSSEQEAWVEALRAQKYYATVCAGWEAAAETIMRYLDGKQVRVPE